MEINQKDNELHLYPINNNEYLGAIKVNASNMRNVVSTTIILDQSGSMGSNVARFVREIIPLVMSKLNYAESYHINLITFADRATTHHLNSRELKASSITTAGNTYIAPAIESFRNILERFVNGSPNEPMRVLTISDGAISDPDPAAYETKKLIEFLAGCDLRINSQAVRLFTSNNQPDTKALSYLLQINNTTATQLYDARIEFSNETIASEIAKMFQKDCFQNYQLLHFERSIVLKFPWNSHASMQVILSPGWNIFWFRQRPSGVVRLGNDTVNVVVQNELELAVFHELMESNLEYITDHMIVLKVVGTPEANGTVNKIFECLKRQEDAVALKSSTSSNKIISNLLDGIAKNNTNLQDSRQMAEFLRNTKNEIKTQRENDRRKREDERKAAEAAEKARLNRIEEEARKVAAQKAADELAARKRIEQETAAKEEQARKVAAQKAADEEAARKKIEEEKAAKEEEARKVAAQKAADEEAARKKIKEEKAAEEEAARKKMEEEKAAEEEAAIKKLEEEKAAELEAALKKLEEEKAAELEAALKKLEEEKAAEDEAVRIKKLGEEKAAEIEAARIKREEAESARIKREANRMKQEEKERIEKELDITVLKSIPDSGLNSFQTVFVLDEHMPGGRENRRFTEKIVPLVLSRLFNESSELVHLVTFVKYKTNFEQLRQSLLQTLDAKKQIRVLVLTNETLQGRQETENLADMLIRFLSVSNYSFELQLVRLASTKSTTKQYKEIDIGVSESHDFVAKQVAGLIDKQMNDLHKQNYVGKVDGGGKHCWLFYIIFAIIFTLLMYRYIYLLPKDN